MAEIIIGIHGMGNKPSARILNMWWKAAIREGLQRIDKPRPFFNFELVYWAHFLHKAPLKPRIKNKKNPLYINDPYSRAPKRTGQRKPAGLRQKIADYLDRQVEKLFLNDRFPRAHESVTEFIIHHFFADLETYYNNYCVEKTQADCHAKDVIRKTLADVLKKHRHKKIMLIAHSMGSIIAYDVLTQHVPDIAIDTFVTLGSPLGLPVIKGKLAGEQKKNPEKKILFKTPENIQTSWHNFSDPKDKISSDVSLFDDFTPNSRNIRPIDHIMTNDYAIRGVANPHKSYGYLRTPELSQIISRFLGTRQISPFAWLKKDR